MAPAPAQSAVSARFSACTPPGSSGEAAVGSRSCSDGPTVLSAPCRSTLRPSSYRPRGHCDRGWLGIGRGIARGFAAFGAKVAIWERHPDTAAAAAEEVGGLGITIDVREPAEVDAALERTVAELGPVSILVNNAGGVFSSPLLETSENGWDALYRSNLKHVILCTQRVAGGMVGHGIGGSIISVTSIEGVRAAPGYTACAAAKAGVINYRRRPPWSWRRSASG